MARLGASSSRVFSLLLLAACGGAPERPHALRGASPLVYEMIEAGEAFDVPARILAAIGWVDTGLVDRARLFGSIEGGEAPRTIGIMGLPRFGRVRSVERAAGLTGMAPERIGSDERENVRAAAAILRALADEAYGPGVLRAEDPRDRWLEVAELYFDAGAAGRHLAFEARRVLARGLRATDDDGAVFEIPAELDPDERELASVVSALRDYPLATWVPAAAANFAEGMRGRGDIDRIVIHTVQGSYSGGIAWFQDPAAGVSAHYVVRSADGDVTQMVEDADIAWHAGRRDMNARSIGIEHEGFIADPSSYTRAMYGASAVLTRWLCDSLGIPPDRQHIIGHVEVPGASHTDPGPSWDWALYMALVNDRDPGAQATGRLRGFVSRSDDPARRLAGVALGVTPGGASTTSSPAGYFELSLAPGDYTLVAHATGYRDARIQRTVRASEDVWGSLALEPSSASAEGTRRLGRAATSSGAFEVARVAGEQLGLRWPPPAGE